MSESPSDIIGPFVVGEIPAPLYYDFQDSNGLDLDLTGYTIKYMFREYMSSVAVTKNASLVGGVPKGRVQYVWDGTELVGPGHYLSEFWAGNGVQRFASLLILFDVRISVGPVPAI